MGKLFERAGFPTGVFNIIITCSLESAPTIGRELCSNRLVKHLSFTGSTMVGKILNAQCAVYIKKTSLELGGNAPFIVFKDADIDSAVDDLILSMFRSSGQTCVYANRIFIHKPIYDEFAKRLKS
jgi:succinate-semialdehyde dehydrogenase/glutarate-semialdehyde dehydrogenase